MDTDKLITIKDKIENLSKIHQIEILRIFNNCNNVTLNENKNGIFINLTDVEEKIIYNIEKYLQYVSKQELTLSEAEIKKGDYISSYFTDHVALNMPSTDKIGVSVTINNTTELDRDCMQSNITNDIKSDIELNIQPKDNKEIELNN